jgi:hypothetical protein
LGLSEATQVFGRCSLLSKCEKRSVAAREEKPCKLGSPGWNIMDGANKELTATRPQSKDKSIIAEIRSATIRGFVYGPADKQIDAEQK